MDLKTPDNVLPIVEGMKNKIVNSAEMMTDTQRMIQEIKRNNDAKFQGNTPKRTMRIMNSDTDNANMNNKSS